MAASNRQGLPLLSGPPPAPPSPPDVSACRKCGKEFGILFSRQRKCMHCGYTYCTSCSDYQALMPRPGPARGHDLTHVCAYCIELLNVTSLGRNQLRSLPLSKLRRYVDAYNIPTKGAVDKLDIVDALIATRTLQGCLPAANEEYYRKHAVPKHSSRGGSSHQSATAYARNFFNRGTSNNPPPTSRTASSHAGNNSRTSNNATNYGANPRAQAFPRPDLDAVYGQPEANYRPYASQSAPASGGRARTASHPSSYGSPNNSRPQAPYGHPRTTSFSRSNHPASDRPTPPPPAPAAPPTPPPLEVLLTRPRSSISTLSVAVLKKILWEAHVRIPPGVCEKEDLVDRVWTFLEEERRRAGGNSDDEDYHEDFDLEEPDAQPGPADPGHWTPYGNRHNNDYIYDELGVLGRERSGSDGDGGLFEMGAGSRSRPGTPHPLGSRSRSAEPHTSTDSIRSKGKSQHGKHVETERSGLCVICQDAEANIAIVDCGHLAMCRDCSDLVMQSSRECPLCRTRIVTEARLLRIFKT
ncbi:hypothetical protein EDD15DRAFT_2250750 [Pisolithus albus]|nr:hypothetical protein EDD15DRAFT_2250750 [Pisolithus albus]